MALQHEVWAELGNESPDWAVLTEIRDWSARLDLFYASGRDVVASILERLPDVQRSRALDFGAGTGRLSFALATEFAQVFAVDPSKPMRAELTRRAIDSDLKISTSAELPEGRFDLVLSLLVLQHLPSRRNMQDTLKALLERVDWGGGFAIEIPVRPRKPISYFQPRFRFYSAARRIGISSRALRRCHLSGMSMRHLPAERVEEIVRLAGCTLQETSVREADRWHYALYVGVRAPRDD